MNKLKRLMAGFMCVGMLFVSGGFQIYATDSPAETEYIHIQDSTDGDATAQETPLLNYLVVGSDYITTSGEQFVLADVGAEGITIEAASLIYINNTTGESYTTAVDTILDTSMLFKFNPKASGVYDVTNLALVIDGQSYTINIAETGVEASFGVDMATDTAPDAVVYEDDSDVEAQEGVIITDVTSGEELTSTQLAEAVSEVEGTQEGVLNNVNSGLWGKTVVVLDPGHGNDGDPGAVCTWNGVTYTERDINLKIALYCKEKLETYDGVIVYMTRTDNSGGLQLAAEEGQELGEIVQFAKDKGADILVSIHNNSSSDSSINGAEVYYPNTNYNSVISATGQGVAEEILKKLEALGLYNRGAFVRYTENNTLYPDGSFADYYGIIRQSKLAGFPGIIIEHAFLSNSSDAVNYLGSDEKLKQLGYADAEAIAEYFKLADYVATEGPGDLEKGSYKSQMNYSAVYNYDYYTNKYPDVKDLYGDDKEAVLAHFLSCGMQEGRQGSDNFDVFAYKNANPELREILGDDLPSYYMHYIRYGKGAYKTTVSETPIVDPVTVYKGVDYSAVYDFEYYISRYSDVKELYSDDTYGALEHFVTIGMAEGRVAIDTFDVEYYAWANPDLADMYGIDYTPYYIHYMENGKAEGRVGTGEIIEKADECYPGFDEDMILETPVKRNIGKGYVSALKVS